MGSGKDYILGQPFPLPKSFLLVKSVMVCSMCRNGRWRETLYLCSKLPLDINLCSYYCFECQDTLSGKRPKGKEVLDMLLISLIRRRMCIATAFTLLALTLSLVFAPSSRVLALAAVGQLTQISTEPFTNHTRQHHTEI